MYHKHSSVASTVTGIAAATLVAGTAAYVLNAKSMKSTRKAMKKTAGKAARMMGDVVDTVVDTVATGIMG